MVDTAKIYERSMNVAQYIVDNCSTIRAAAKEFGVSKSTVHKNIHTVVKNGNPDLYAQVCIVLQINTEERAMRGGLATRKKYSQMMIDRENQLYYTPTDNEPLTPADPPSSESPDVPYAPYSDPYILDAI